MTKYDNQFIAKTIAVLFTDIMYILCDKQYLYAVNEDFSNLGEPSKSFIRIQFYVDDDNNMYLSYILDPNTVWANSSISGAYYQCINDYILERCRHNLLSGLKIEILMDEASNKEFHELNSKCRSEETNRSLYDDTIGVWKSIDGLYRFMRNRSILIEDKSKVYYNTDKESFSDYRREVRSINNQYKSRFLTDNTSIKEAFDEYKVVYENYFGRELKVIEESDLIRFSLLDCTDYNIIKK